MNRPGQMTRRGLLSKAACSLAGGTAALHLPRWALAQAATAAGAAAPAAAEKSRVAVAQGDARAATVLESLKRIEADIRRGLAGKKRLIIKPNMVHTATPLCASHADCIEAQLDFFSSIFKGELIVAESSANAPATEGFDNYGYAKLSSRYKFRLMDLDFEPTVIEHVVDERYQPHPVRVYKTLMDPDVYLVSSAVMKTHDRAVVTLALKNIVLGAAGKDTGFRWGPGSKGSNDKPVVHGGPKNEGIHYNMFKLAQRVRPHLAIVDGFQGMEGNGPVAGTPVDHKVVVASTDWLAADRTAVDLMGFDFAKIAYLGFCAQAGMGQADLARIEILGNDLKTMIRKYRPHDNIEQQYERFRKA